MPDTLFTESWKEAYSVETIDPTRISQGFCTVYSSVELTPNTFHSIRSK